MDKSADQAIYDAIMKMCIDGGVKVEGYKVGDGVSEYPCVCIDGCDVDFFVTKSCVKPVVTCDVSCWARFDERDSLSYMTSYLFYSCFKLTDAFGYSCRFVSGSSSVRYMDDFSTTLPLRRAVLQLVFRIL